MKKKPLGGALIDECPTCHSHWLDHGELEASMNRGDEKTMLKQAFSELNRERAQTTSKQLCPRCQSAPLSRFVMHGVSLDRCGRCQGIWFDPGELEKVRAVEGQGLFGWLSGIVKNIADAGQS